MKRSIFVIFGLLLAAAFLSGVTNLPAWGAEREKLTVADQYDPTTMDPIGHNDVPSSRACYQIYDTLIFLNQETGLAEPGLAKKWEFLSDTAYKFYLRRGVKFHNGEELKASDVRFSIMRATTDLGAKIRTYSQNVKDVEVLDDYTVVIHLKNVDYSFFPSLAHSWGSIVNQKAVEAAGDSYGLNPVGTGPFKFVSWQKSNRYVLERFDDYWGPKVKYKTLEVRSVPEPTSRTIELESGGVDISFPIVHNDIKRVQEHEKLTLLRTPLTSVAYLGFNMTKAPFTDVRVRRAIYAALDTAGMQAAVLRGVGTLPRSLVPAAIKYSIHKDVPVHEQNVEEAKKLLAEAGVKDLKLEIWTNERKERVDMATIIQAQLQEVGIQASIKVLEWGAYLNGLVEKKHDLFILGWVSTVPDPNFAVAGLLETGAGSNYTFTSDKKLDELLVRGRSLPDGPEREAIYKEMQLYINDLLPMIYLYGDEGIVGTQNYVRGFVPKTNEVHSFRETWFEDGESK